MSRAQLLRVGFGRDAQMVSTRTLERALDEAAFLSLVSDTSLGEAVKRNPGRLAASLRRHEAGSTRTRSELEEHFLKLIREAGLPQPEVNEKLGPYTIDFLWRERRLAVETDGGASHARRSARERDARRDAWLAANDYQCLRFTWRQVTERPHEVLAAVRSHTRPLWDMDRRRGRA